MRAPLRSVILAPGKGCSPVCGGDGSSPELCEVGGGVFPEEIEGVVTDVVQLRVTRDELLNS